MLHSSGIGSYERALLPRVIRRLAGLRFCLLGNVEELRAEPWVGELGVGCRALRAGVYSAAEQPLLTLSTPAATRVFWAPHVNAPLMAPGRLLVTVHDAFYADPPRGAEPRLDKRLYLRLMLAALRRRPDAIICVSEFTRAELLRLLGSFRGRLHAVPSGLEPLWFVPPVCSRPHPAPYLVYVGNLKPHKNLGRTLEAFGRIAERVPHDFLVIGGGERGPLERGLSEAVRSRVRFLGSLSGDALRCHVAHAAGLVLASLYEGFGMPPVEAMALGVPVLVSRAASLPEVCGDAALYCDPYSVADIARGLERLLGDEAERERLRTRGPERARSLDWERCADRTAAILHELC